MGGSKKVGYWLFDDLENAFGLLIVEFDEIKAEKRVVFHVGVSTCCLNFWPGSFATLGVHIEAAIFETVVLEQN